MLSTTIVVPEMKSAASLERNAIAAAMSSGRPMRAPGNLFLRAVRGPPAQRRSNGSEGGTEGGGCRRRVIHSFNVLRASELHELISFLAFLVACCVAMHARACDKSRAVPEDFVEVLLEERVVRRLDERAVPYLAAQRSAEGQTRQTRQHRHIKRQRQCFGGNAKQRRPGVGACTWFARAAPCACARASKQTCSPR